MTANRQHAAPMGLRKCFGRIFTWDTLEAAVVAVAIVACVNALVEFWRWIGTPPV